MKNKKILIISNNNGFGGSEVLWLKLAHLLADLDYEIGLAVFRWKNTPDTFRELIGRKNVKVFYRKDPRSGFRMLQHIQSRLTNQRQVWQSFHADFAILSMGQHADTMLQPYYLKRAHIPYSIIFQLVTEMNRSQGNPRYGDEIMSAVKTYFASAQNKELLEKQLAEPLVNSKVIYNSFQVNDDSPFRWPADDSVFNLAMVCRLDPYHKGIDLLFEALSNTKWKQRNIRIRLYGESEGFGKPYLQKLKEYYDLPFVSFEGYRKDVSEIWADNHALLLPSRQEGMSLALIEAMLFGRVCITTDVGGAREIIEHGSSGFIAGFPIVKDIDSVLEEAWKNRDRWKEIGFAAYTTIRKKLVKKPEHDIGQDVEEFFGVPLPNEK